MALERRRPLPAGRYWLDVFEPNQLAWGSWVDAMTRMVPPRATIEVTQHFEGTDGAGPHDFVIFSTPGENVAWEAAGLPSPTIAGPEIQTSDDTVQKPPPEPDLVDQLGDLSEHAKGITTGLKVAGFIAVVVVVGSFALKRK